jgi:hypothetical protein
MTVSTVSCSILVASESHLRHEHEGIKDAYACRAADLEILLSGACDKRTIPFNGEEAFL